MGAGVSTDHGGKEKDLTHDYKNNGGASNHHGNGDTVDRRKGEGDNERHKLLTRHGEHEDGVDDRGGRQWLRERSSPAKVRAKIRLLQLKQPEESGKGLKDTGFLFENLVFEGGGGKGLAHIGVVRVLEQSGLRKYVRRVAGTSAGGLLAGAFALGYSSEELIKLLTKMNLGDVIQDNSFGIVQDTVRTFFEYGWNAGKEAHSFIGDMVKRKSGDPDLSFLALYKRFNIELCVVASNLTRACPAYFHVKTTPYVPIRDALRATMSIPLFLKPWTGHTSEC